MNKVHAWFAIVCLSAAGITGCGASGSNGGSGADATESTSTSQQKLVRYTQADVDALKPGASLGIDLSVPNTVFQVEYKDTAMLSRIVVVRGDEQYLLSDSAPPKSDTTTLSQIVIAGEDSVDGSGVTLASPKITDELGKILPMTRPVATCKCPCCIVNKGVMYCCG